MTRTTITITHTKKGISATAKTTSGKKPSETIDGALGLIAMNAIKEAMACRLIGPQPHGNN